MTLRPRLEFSPSGWFDKCFTALQKAHVRYFHSCLSPASISLACRFCLASVFVFWLSTYSFNDPFNMSGYGDDQDDDHSSGFASITPRVSQIKCERPSCGKILPPGVQLYVLHDKKSTSQGFGVCPECRAYYDRKPGGIIERSKSKTKQLVQRTGKYILRCH